jgi:hypothetical protein
VPHGSTFGYPEVFAFAVLERDDPVLPHAILQEVLLGQQMVFRLIIGPLRVLAPDELLMVHLEDLPLDETPLDELFEDA